MREAFLKMKTPYIEKSNHPGAIKFPSGHCRVARYLLGLAVATVIRLERRHGVRQLPNAVVSLCHHAG
jgi:hypothetical protein